MAEKKDRNIDTELFDLLRLTSRTMHGGHERRKELLRQYKKAENVPLPERITCHDPGPIRREHKPEKDHRERGPRLHRERILVILKGSEGGLRQKEIAEKMMINPSSLSELVDKLEGDGYITRKTDPEDKRATLILPTQEGLSRAQEIEDAHNEEMQLLFTNLSEEEKQELSALLRKMLGR